MDKADLGAGPALADSHPQRVEDQVGAHVGGELPAHDPAAECVEDKCEEHDALPAAQVGQVGDPQLVRPLGGEVALDEVGPPVGLGVGRRRPPRLAASLGTLDPFATH